MVDRRRGGRSTAGRPAAAIGGAGKGGDALQKKGEKGAGKGKDDIRKGASKGNGKSKGDGKGKNAPLPPPQERHVAGAKTVQELEAEMLHSKMALGTTKERREASKTPMEAKGNFCEVKKHSEMGCAVVSFMDQASRDAVMQLAENKGSEEKKDEKRALMKISGVDVQLRAHFDKAKQEEIKTDIFVAWGRQQEKQHCLGVEFIAEAIDLLMIECRGGQLAQASPMGSPLNQPEMAPMLPQSLTQMLLPQPMVPGQQQHQQVEYMKMLWAAQQHAAAQQMQAAPASPKPSTNTGLETPPRPVSMRADAPDFTPPPVQQFLDPYAVNELDQYADWNVNQMAYDKSPTKRFEIVDPNSGEKITAPKISLSEGATIFEPQFGARKAKKIIDPTTNQPLEMRGMILEQSSRKKFSIKDPTSGTTIQV